MTTATTNSYVYYVLPVLICGLSIPFSMFMWIGNIAISKLFTSEHAEYDVIPPSRWLFSSLVPTLFMLYALKRRGVSRSGAILGLVTGIILSIANHAFLASLSIFFFTSTRATKFRSHMKKKLEEDFKEGGQRNWAQVLCNAGMGTQLALLYLLDCGSGERPIDFTNLYRSSWLCMGVMSSFACCNGDTWASELGSVIGNSEPFLIISRRRVPRGTNGGVTTIGLIVSFLGGIAVGLGYYLTVIYTVDAAYLERSPKQWPIIIFGGIAGLLGSLIDSVIGATLQYSGQDENGKIVEKPGKKVKYISGIRILDNHSVNLISSILTGVLMPVIANRFWF